MQKGLFSPYPDLPEKDLISKVLDPKLALQALESMLLIRHLETRGEAAYQHGFVGGFYHSYAGQEAIQTSAVQVFGTNQWYIATYRCHALAYLLGATPNEIMAELYGRATGVAKGRGGSMHLYADTLLGGFGIVGGHLPSACGAAFSAKYLEQNRISVCFLGDGAVAQGAFHESLNIASLWNLPVIFIIENNVWGMGTRVDRAICIDRIAEKQAPSYNMQGYTLDGMNYFHCRAGFQHIFAEVQKTSRPVLVECLCERFRGHSISDPGVYRSKQELEEAKQRDPIVYMRHVLEERELLTAEEFQEIERKAKQRVLDAMQFAEESPFPEETELEEGVYAES
ncbi:MAG: pyruvate dehydrogenase (acetyl-transferring) E1 component subunit alpha [Chlamydiales bacterium]